MPETVDGPRLLVLAGVHGDEREPIEAVRRLEAALATVRVRGRVLLVPEANPTACAAGTRLGTDGLDMARSFPGDPDGSPTQRAAHAVTEHIRGADALIDLHTGGRALRVLPMTGYMLHRDPVVLDGQRRMARAFGLPVIWGTSATLEGRSLSAARDRGVPAIYAEHGGGDTLGTLAIAAGAEHVIRAAAAGLLLSLRPDSATRAGAPLAVILEHEAGGDGT